MEEEHSPVSEGDLKLIEAVSSHMSDYFGDVAMVYHELVSPLVHIDVHHILPSGDSEHHTLFTTGMSERPMPGAKDHPDAQFAELIAHLQPDFPGANDTSTFHHSWIVRQMLRLARYPHRANTFLSNGHSIENQDSKPYDTSTNYSAILLLMSRSFSEEDNPLILEDGRSVNFLQVVPLYREELQLKMNKGINGLFAAAAEKRVHPADLVLIDNRRPNVAKRGGLIGFRDR